MKCATILLLSLLAVFNASEGIRILGVFPWSSRSHFILGSTLLKGLASKGHQVTMISPFPQSKPVKNLRNIALPDYMLAIMTKNAPVNTNVTFFTRNDLNFVKQMGHIYTMGATLMDLTLGDEQVQHLLKSNEQFDAIIIDTFMTEPIFALGHHFGAPVIGFSTVSTVTWTNALVGNPSSDAYIPNVFLSYTDHMTFTERMSNTFANLYSSFYREYYYWSQQEATKDKYFPGTPPLNTLWQSASLILMNSHVSLTYPRPLVPNIIEIGGFHVAAPKKLPDDLQKYLDEATDGVIYFSMGSNLKSKDFPIEKREAFLKAFGKLKQKVLWKWEEDVLPNQPENVKLGKWLPQQDILAHPNVRLFITHGGLLSTTEAIARGVPLIGIPIFGDQHMNMGRAVRLGFGLLLEFKEITADTVFSSISEILNNPKYNENAKHRSAVMNDQQVTPVEKAVYWVEYVVRHKGAKHLRTGALDLHWTQVLLLDVVAFVAVIVLGTIGAIYFLCKKIFEYLKLTEKFKQKTN